MIYGHFIFKKKTIQECIGTKITLLRHNINSANSVATFSRTEIKTITKNIRFNKVSGFVQKKNARNFDIITSCILNSKL